MYCQAQKLNRKSRTRLTILIPNQFSFSEQPPSPFGIFFPLTLISGFNFVHSRLITCYLSLKCLDISRFCLYLPCSLTYENSALSMCFPICAPSFALVFLVRILSSIYYASPICQPVALLVRRRFALVWDKVHLSQFCLKVNISL